MTVAVSGLYLVTGWAQLARSSGSAQFRLRLLGGGVKLAETRLPSTGQTCSLSASYVDQLEVGDVITAQVEGLAAADTIPAGNARLSAVRIGPVRWT